MTEFSYVGNELDVFAHAVNWKRYLARVMRPWIAGDVAEVGAGIGANTQLLTALGRHRRWTCIEPDPALAHRLAGQVAAISPAQWTKRRRASLRCSAR